MTSFSATDARAALPELLNRVQNGDEIAITRHGQVVAVLLHPDKVQHRRAVAALESAAHLHELLARAASPEPDPAEASITSARAEELIAAVRRDRDRD